MTFENGYEPAPRMMAGADLAMHVQELRSLADRAGAFGAGRVVDALNNHISVLSECVDYYYGVISELSQRAEEQTREMASRVALTLRSDKGAMPKVK